MALDTAERMPEDMLFVIPARLEDCPVPERLSRWQRVDLFVEEGYQRLQRSLEAHSVPEAAACTQIPIDAADEARPAASDQGPVTVRLDGMYTHAGEDMTRFIRFFPPNTAVSVTVGSEEPLATLMPKVERWLRPADPELGEGMFEIDGESIRWDDTHGTVLYRGTISGAGTELHLHSHSLINGHESYGVWRFAPLQAAAAAD